MPTLVGGFWTTDVPDNVPYKHNKAFCKNYYWEILKIGPSPSWKTIICTAVILLGAILLELLTHTSWEHRNRFHRKNLDADQSEAEEALLSETFTEQPEPEDGAPAAIPPPMTESSQQKKTMMAPVPGYMFCCASNPTPQSRATRLACAFVIYPFILAAFIVRMNTANSTPFVMADCRSHIHAPPPNWTAIAFLNIIPFVCASFAFLRAVVDCVLVRFDTGLADTVTDKKVPWLACLPITGPVIFGFGCACLVGVGVLKCVQIPVALIMGRYEMSDVLKRWGDGEEVEMMGEEGRGLVEGMERDERSDGPPAYDEVVSEGGMEERRGNRKEDTV